LFVNNPNWKSVDVISTQTRQVVSHIPIPEPAGLDLGIDGSTVFVGTWTRQLFAIDINSLRVRASYTVPQVRGDIGTWSVVSPKQLSDGTIFLLATDNVLGGTQLGVWDLSTNSIVSWPTFYESYDSIAKSSNGKKVLLASTSSSGEVAIYDTASKSFTHHPFIGNYGITAVAVNPNGTRFVFFDDQNLSLYNQGFQKIGAIPAGTVGGLLEGAVFSSDGTRLYLVLNSDMTPTIVTVDATNLALLGTAPAIPLRPPHGDMAPPFTVAVPFGVDNSGLIFGATDHGVTFEDSTYYQTFGAIGSPIYNNNVTPTSGPLNSSTRISFWWGNAFQFVSDVWFGDQRGINPAFDTPGQLYVSSPPSSSPGPVNLKVIEPSGVMVFNAQAFSYGPSILNVSGNLVPPGGGTTADLFGFGIPTDPTKVDVKVGDTPAQVLSSTNFGYALLPAVDVKLIVPPGTPGKANLKLTTPTGSTTFAASIRYVRSFTTYPLMGYHAALLFDRFRNRVYATAADHIDVLALDSGTLQSPISVPTVNGLSQLGGMALTPDGSKLLVTNTADGSVVVLNPDKTSSAQAIPIVTPSVNLPCASGPLSIAATNDGRAMIFTGNAPSPSCAPGGSLYFLNLATRQVTLSEFRPFTCGSSYVVAVGDGSKVGLGSYGSTGFCIYSTANDSYTAVDTFYGLMGAAAAADGNVFAAGWKIVSPEGLTLKQVALPDPLFDSLLSQFQNQWSLPLEKLNDSGSLLFTPWTHSVDIFDVARGQPVLRLSLPDPVATAMDPLAINSDGSQMFLLTNAGLASVDIGWLPVSFGSASPSSGTPGTSVRIRGTGFTPATAVEFNGVPAVASYVDSSTISVVVPAVSSSLARLVLKTPGEPDYSVEGAFTVK
jgi:hypothetical protein